ncbi:MAG: ATP synthase F0 subunit B [Clostridia bacterium]|nr:ATP synthase F0 subunit B [Clostridia bacterium]
MTVVLSDAILGLSLTKFLLHLLNFAILFTVLWIVLYKPVRKFIRERQERIEKQQKDAQENLRSSEEARKEAEDRLRALDEELAEKRAAAEKETEAACDRLVADASARAETIVKTAEEKAKRNADEVVAGAKASVKDVAVTLAESILGEKVDEVDDSLIDAALKDWKNG